jgi:hypothetical protein
MEDVEDVQADVPENEEEVVVSKNYTSVEFDDLNS